MSLSRHIRKGRVRRRWKCQKHGNTTAYGSEAECGCNARMYQYNRKKLVQKLNPRRKRKKVA